MRNKLLIRLIPVLLLALTSCTIGRMAVFQFSDIKDHKKFPKRELKPSDEPFRFTEVSPEPFSQKRYLVKHIGRPAPLDSLLETSQTVAFMVIRNDSILCERYFHKYAEEDVVASFSMAKSFTSALVGVALHEGHIKSINDRITDYIPELEKRGMEDVKILHLLQMTSGIKHAEHYYNPFAGVARLYYGRRLHKQAIHLKKEMDSGLDFNYKSINTQLLGEIVVRATGKNLTEYLQEKIWTPIGMEHPASWSIDQKRNGMEKAFCCLNATARDFAKFGRLYLHEGNWEGRQLVPAEWVRASTQQDEKYGAASFYQYQWWLPSAEGDFVANGHLGQYIYVNPDKQVLMVRLGKKQGDVNWMGVFRNIAAQL